MDALRKAAQDLGIRIPLQKVLDTYTCEGCGETVKETQFTAQGKTFVKPVGCRCEDIKLAEQAKQTHSNMINRKARDMFNTNSIVNRSLQGATFKNYQPPTEELKDAWRKVGQYIKDFDPEGAASNLLLVGTYGTGKSHLAYASVKYVLDRGHTAIFLSLPKLLTKIRDTYNSNSQFSEGQLMEMVGQVDLLVLDDVGAEYTNMKNADDNWAQSKLFEIMDSRAGRHTIYTTNLGSDKLEVKVNERNFSRMMGNTEIIKMEGPDFRRKQF